jgi:cytochrome c oxidase subunit III
MLNVISIAMLVAITVWWFLVRRLREKPWTKQGVLSGSQEGLTSSAPKVGLWFFLAMVSSLFGLFASAYMLRMTDSHPGLAAWQPLDDPSILWVNTLILVVASAAMQIARARADQGDLQGVRNYFTSAGVLTVVFLAGQVLAWRLANSSGEYGPGSPAYSFFVLLTAVHGLHLVGGLFVLARTASRVWQGVGLNSVVARSQIRLSVQLCTLYWHWLLLIWLGIFALLLST